tara:strand:+ start:165 stop:365 length:201 start_codon:yes stop_codon:yes gene_type:complete
MAPQTVGELVDLLDQLYPSRCPDLHDTDREIWYSVGQRSVVEKCIQMISLEEEDDDDDSEDNTHPI